MKKSMFAYPICLHKHYNTVESVPDDDLRRLKNEYFYDNVPKRYYTTPEIFWSGFKPGQHVYINQTSQ